jgi:hypothetical protein
MIVMFALQRNVKYLTCNISRTDCGDHQDCMVFWDRSISVVDTVKYLFNEPVEKWLFSDKIGIFHNIRTMKTYTKKA